MKKFLPRPSTHSMDLPAVSPPNPAGFGRRSIWPLPPVGEAARRDPHIPDPVQNAGPPVDQRNVSPPVAVKHWHGKPISVGDGIEYNGLYAGVVYLKWLGNHVTRTLARSFLQANYESRWRLGGIGYPPDFGYGPGYNGDAGSLWPNNPQTYLRNPGIRPMINVPATFRIANMVQDVGPSIADFGNMPAPGNTALGVMPGTIQPR